MKESKVVFVIPNTRWFDKRAWLSIPYSALIITRILKHYCEFSIIDANGEDYSFEQCLDVLEEAHADVVLVSSMSIEYYKQVHKVCELAKLANKNTVTVIGGIYATTLPERAVLDRNIDWVFMHHAEERLLPFLGSIIAGEADSLKEFKGVAYLEKNRVVENPIQKYIGHVKEVVKPDYSLINYRNYNDFNNKYYQFNSTKPSATIITTYGCPYNCIFCASRSISGKRVLYRPIEHILEEIDELVESHNVGNLIFLDDFFLANRKRVNQLLKTFTERKYEFSWKGGNVTAWHLDDELLELMKESGCCQLTISVESGSQRVLSEVIKKPMKLEIIPQIVKKCRELGIDLGANFVIGNPGETWDEIRQTFKYAEELDLDLAHFHIATPFPRTDLYRICLKEGYLPSDFDFLNDKYFGFGNAVITTPEFTPVELKILRAFEYDRINFSTLGKKKKIASMYMMSLDELDEHRSNTRKKLGIHF